MPQSKDKDEPNASNPTDARTDVFAVVPPANLPAPEAILERIPFTAPSGKKFTIVRTNEVDEYEEAAGLGPEAFAALNAEVAAVAGDGYGGKDRMAAKLFVSNAAIEEFKDVADLIYSLPSIEEMVSHKPKITIGPDSKRVAEENRNVRVHAFLYAASREKDNDYHLILGRDPNAVPPMYLTMEISGLPDTSNEHYGESGLPDPSDPTYKKIVNKLTQARNAYKDFFGTALPGLGYDRYPALPVVIEGALFFDMTHSSGQRPGPQNLRINMPTIWEVHPITKIVFE